MISIDFVSFTTHLFGAIGISETKITWAYYNIKRIKGVIKLEKYAFWYFMLSYSFIFKKIYIIMRFSWLWKMLIKRKKPYAPFGIGVRTITKQAQNNK